MAYAFLPCYASAARLFRRQFGHFLWHGLFRWKLYEVLLMLLVTVKIVFADVRRGFATTRQGLSGIGGYAAQGRFMAAWIWVSGGASGCGEKGPALLMCPAGAATTMLRGPQRAAARENNGERESRRPRKMRSGSGGRVGPRHAAWTG
jgi:hypothetical protein